MALEARGVARLDRMSARHATLLAALSADLGRLLPADQVRAGRLLAPAMIVSAALPARLGRAVRRAARRAALAGARCADMRARPKWALILGVTAVTAPFLLITFGEHVVPSGLTAVLISPASLFVALLAPFILTRASRSTAARALGMLLGLARRGARRRRRVGAARSRSSSARWR